MQSELQQYKNNDYVSKTVVAEYEENDLRKMMDLTAMTSTITIDRNTLLNEEINKWRNNIAGMADSLSTRSKSASATNEYSNEQMFDDVMIREIESKITQELMQDFELKMQ